MSITRPLFLLYFLLLPAVAFAQEQQQSTPMEVLDSLVDEEDVSEERTEAPLVNDSSAVDLRSFKKTKVQEMLDDPEMDYGQDSPAVVSLWDRIKMWLIRAISWLFHIGESTRWGNVVVGILIMLVIGYVILRLLKIDALKMFYSGSSQAAMQYETLEDNIHEMDFDKLISEALSRNEFRLAIRLVFLHGLKMLADKHHITWDPGKTNHDYLNELKAKELRTGFNELNFYFEYAWYGNFTINHELYVRVADIFNTWKTNIR